MANKDIINALFIRAAREKNWDDLKRLLEKVEDVNVRGKYGHTALMWVAEYGNLEIAKLLIECGASVTVKSDLGETALMWAAGTCKDVEIIDLLLEQIEDKDVNERDNGGKTALMWAEIGGNEKVAERLRFVGAKG